MKSRKRTVVIAAALTVSLLFLAVGILTASLVSKDLENTLGAVYEADTGAARVVADVLLSGQKGNGEEAAGALGLTERFFTYLNQRIFGGIWWALLIVLTVLPFCTALFFLRREKKRREALTLRVESALAGETAFYPENEEERLLGNVLSEYGILREKTAQRLSQQRIETENIAHELKTPVSGMLLTLDLVSESGMTQERSERLRDDAERMQRYISDLLTLSRLRAGKVRILMEDVDLTAMLSEMAQEMPGLSVTGDPAVIPGDRERLWDAFHNLAANALRYGKDGTCRIRISGTGEAVCVELVNRGERQPSLERYVAGQEDGTSSGLGTAIAGEIVRAHFGTLSAECSQGLICVTAVFPVHHLKQKEAV